ncbi:M48 family metalloprotease [Myxococcaceae bacterium GXIMD 01537]
MGLAALALAACASKPKPPPDNEARAAQLKEDAQQVAQRMKTCVKLRAQVSLPEEAALGGAVALNWVKGGGGLMLADAPEVALQRYVNLVGRNLAAQSTRPSLEWTFGVLKDAQAYNASSAPAGFVFVTRGLLQDVRNEAQLAGVLAHEIAHVTLKHALTRYDDVKVGQCRMAVGLDFMMQRVRAQGTPEQMQTVSAFTDALSGNGSLDVQKHPTVLATLADKVVEQLVAEGFSKADEHAADAEAVRLLISAGYEPQEYIRFLGTLPEAGRGYAHHPGNAERQERLRALLADAARPGEDFPELPAATRGLQAPALAPAFAAARLTK